MKNVVPKYLCYSLFFVTFSFLSYIFTKGNLIIYSNNFASALILFVFPTNSELLSLPVIVGVFYYPITSAASF